MSEVRNVSNQNKQQLNTLRKTNDIEVAKVQLAHQKRVNDIKNQNEIELINIKSQFENKRAQEIKRNEEVLEKLKKNVEETKKVTSREIQNLQDTYQKRKDGIQQDFEDTYTNLKATNSLKLQDLNEEAKVDIQKLNRKVAFEKNEIESSARSEQRIAQNSYKTQIQSDKNNYFKEVVSQQDKFQEALLNQKKNNKKQLVTEERKHQKIIDNSQKQHLTMMEKLRNDSINKRDLKLSHFEKEYNNLNDKNEKLLQKLIGKKEKIIHHLQKDLLYEYKLGLEKYNDPFYDFGKLDPIITTKDKSYEIAIPVPVEDSSHVSLKGEDRTLTLTFERRNDFSKDEDNGSLNTVKKFESYVSKIPVENIVNPSTLKKSFKDGMVVFNIDFK